MYAVDISSNYQQRHPGSPPLSVDGQREYNAASYGSNGNRYLDDNQHKDDRFGYIEGGINPPSDLLLSQTNRFRDDHEDRINYRYPSEQGLPGGSHVDRPSYENQVESNYGVSNPGIANQYSPRQHLEMDSGFPRNQLQYQREGDAHYPHPPYYGSEGFGRNGRADEAYSDQLSSTQEVNPLDERFSEQDTIPLDERYSDIVAMNRRFGAGQGLSDGDHYDGRNSQIGLNNWNPSSQGRDENMMDGSLRESVLRLSIQDNRPSISQSPYSQPRPASATPMQPLNTTAHRSPSVSSQPIDSKWRNPDLREVIDYLNHQNDAIKANAAAYLQHLCYMDDNIKAQTRVLRGIPALVDLISHPLPEVHRAACGALRNLSYGRANDENKVEIRNVGGITVLVRLLRKTGDNDVREVITGILWNLSSCTELKKSIIEEGVKSIVDAVIIPTATYDKMRGPNDSSQNVAYRSTVFRNASGVLRNVSSDGDVARKKLRECEGLVESMISILNSAVVGNDIDNKSVENCVCLLRNLSYACQEVVDPDYLKKRSAPLNKSNDDSISCFGGKSKKKNTGKDNKGNQNGQFKNPSPQSLPVRGMELLWSADIIRLYLRLLHECSNPETLEAAAGAIQNLAACDWQPSVDIRNAVRVEKGIPVIVALIKEPSDKVVCAAATTLRNLALDERNKQLIGKYVMHDMVSKLPSQDRAAELALSNETIAAMEATLYEVIKSSSEFAKLLMQEGGIERLMHIVRSPLGIYNGKVVRYASQLLQKMWSFTEFHEEYKRKGWKQSDFLTSPTLSPDLSSDFNDSSDLDPRSPERSKSQMSSAENTINRPHMAQSGVSMPGYNDRTMLINRNPQQRQYADPMMPNVSFASGQSADSRINLTDMYASHNRIADDIPLTRLEYNDQLHQDPGLHHSFQPGYDLPAYRAEPPEYEGHGHMDSVQGYGASGAHLNRYNGSLEESYGSQTMHPQVNPVSLGSYGRGDSSSNAFDGHSQDVNYRAGYESYPTMSTRDHEPLYSAVTKSDRYGDLTVDVTNNKAADVDSWV